MLITHSVDTHVFTLIVHTEYLCTVYLCHAQRCWYCVWSMRPVHIPMGFCQAAVTVCSSCVCAPVLASGYNPDLWPPCCLAGLLETLLTSHPPATSTQVWCHSALAHFAWRPALWGLSCLVGHVMGLAMSSFPRPGSRGCLIWPSFNWSGSDGDVFIHCSFSGSVWTPNLCVFAVGAYTHVIRGVCTLLNTRFESCY